MALVKCPECGRNNVSDTALACPDCGFGVKAYYSNETDIKTDEDKLEVEQEQKPKAVRCNECGAIYLSDSVGCPSCGSQEKTTVNRQMKAEKPKFSKGYIIGVIVGLVVALLGLSSVISDESARASSISRGNGDPHVTGTILILFGIVILCIPVYLFINSLRRYNIKISNPELYNKMIIEENIKRQNQYKAQRQEEQARLAKLPECPICKSKAHVRRISSLDRGVSVAIAGLASSKIGKQYECTSCKHKF